jgi:hypothetical protein
MVLGCGRGFGGCHAIIVLVWAWAMFMGYGTLVWNYGTWVKMGELLRDLVLLKKLVWLMGYVLIKNLICSNLNYLGVIDTMTSKVF